MSRDRKSRSGFAEPFSEFGPPLLLEGEDESAYHAMADKIRKVIRPADFIDEMFLNDIVYLQWDILRLRRLKAELVESHTFRTLAKRVAEPVADELRRESKVKKMDLNISPHQQAVFDAAALAGAEIAIKARAQKLAEEMIRGWAAGETTQVRAIDQILNQTSWDAIRAQAIAENIDQFERIDRMIAMAETRRNVFLTEIEMRAARSNRNRRVRAVTSNGNRTIAAPSVDFSNE